MITTTTPQLAERATRETLGIVTGQAIIGANIFRDFMAGVTNIVGGRATGYENALREARDLALAEMVEEARRLGGEAIVSVDLDYEALGVENGMLMVSATGTAVKLV